MRLVKTVRGTAAIAARRRGDAALDQAARLKTAFHQQGPKELLESIDSIAYRKDFAVLGDLISLEVIPPRGGRVVTLSWESPAPRVDSAPDGRSLYFLGGDQSVNLERFGLPRKAERDLVMLGECRKIAYFTHKGFHNFEPTEYRHKFGTVDRRPDLLESWQRELGRSQGRFPSLAFDALNERLLLVGGAYKVHREGIVY